MKRMLTCKTIALVHTSHTTHLPKKLHLTHKSLTVNERKVTLECWQPNTPHHNNSIDKLQKQTHTAKTNILAIS